MKFPQEHIVWRALTLSGTWHDEDIRTDLPFSDLRFHAIPADGSVDQKLRYYEILRSYVEHEDNLISGRLNWSLTIQGFLFTAFALLAGRAAELMKPLSRGADLDLGALMTLLAFLMVLGAMSVLAIATSTASYDAITAAHRAITSLDQIVHATVLTDSLPPHDIEGVNLTMTPERFASDLLLPRAIGGGAPKESTHHRAGSYYTGVPRWIIRIWVFVFAATAASFISVVVLLIRMRCH